MRRYPILTIILIILFAISFVFPSIAQDNLTKEKPKVWVGMNLGVHFDFPGLTKSNFDFAGTPETSSENDLPYIYLFMANRINRDLNINTGLGLMNSITSINATYVNQDVNSDGRLLGQVNQSILSFSWKIEYWDGQQLVYQYRSGFKYGSPKLV